MSKEKIDETYTEFETSISTKWLLWLGAITMAFGAIFLVKYSIEAGVFPPIIRVLIGTAIGIAMTIGGECVRRKRLNIEWLMDKPDYLPSAISAAGLFTLFASIFSAYALYELIPMLAAYMGLAIVAFSASYLAQYQGRFFAQLGLIGGMIIPALLSSGSFEEWALFPYLMLVIVSSLWVAQKFDWTDITISALGIGLFWVIVWIIYNPFDYNIIPISLYIITLGAVSSYLLRGKSPSRQFGVSTYSLIPGHLVTLVSDVVIFSCFAMLVAFVKMDSHSIISLLFLATAVAMQALAMRKSQEFDMGFIAAVLASCIAIITSKTPTFADVSILISSAEAGELILVALSFAGSISIYIACSLSKLLRQKLWAMIGVLLPILALIYTYWRVSLGSDNFAFAVAAIIMAISMFAVVLQAKNNPERFRKTVLVTYLSGATMALSLAIAFALQDAWLTFALALQVAALGHIWKKLQFPALRFFAYGLTVVVILRLIFNPAIFGYGGVDNLSIINWLWYGYGLTAVLFAYAATLFKTENPTSKLVNALKATAALLLIAFTTLEIHVIFSETGSLLSDPTAFEAAIQTVNWSIATGILYWMESKGASTLFISLRKLMTVLSVIGLIVGGAWMNNIFMGRVDVGPMAIFNLQLMQFLIPGLVYAYKAKLAKELGKGSETLYATLAFGLIWYWITAEVRHAFHPTGGSALTSNWEWYSYSAAWLAYALIILMAGMKTTSRTIRKAGLGMLAVVILKVFLFDMNHLEGIARALSFMGLGATMIGIGYLYQRMMMSQRKE